MLSRFFLRKSNNSSGQPKPYWSKSWHYRLVSFALGLVLALGITVPVKAISWLDLIRSGAQILQLSNISDKQEMELGAQINQELINSGQAKIYRNPAITNYINRLGQEMVRTSARSGINYTFQVVDDDGINAFATMGGYVYLNKGLIARADNESELASVIGHEIGHIVGKHSIKQLRQRAIAQGALSAAGVDRSQAVQIGVELAVNRRKSRRDEFEADQLGLSNLTQAGYAPAGMLGFMQKLLEGGGRSVPTFISTHPATSERIRRLQAEIPPERANQGKGLNNQAYRNQIRGL